MRPLVGLTSIVLLSASAAIGQVRETVNVNYVEVPVTVLDRSGDPVRGLTKDRFEILDQGKVREITSFETIDFASPQSLKSTSPLNPAVRRSFLLLFDLSFSSPVGRLKAQEAARNFLVRGLHGRDLAAVGTIDVERGFRLLTAFTTDRSLLSAAIANPVNFKSSDPLQIAGTLNFEVQPDQKTTNAPEADAIADFQKELARGERRLNDQFNRSRAEREIKLLAVLAQTMRVLTGRKEVVFFSEGFDPKLIQGRDARSSSSDQLEEMDQITSGEYWKVDSDARYGNTTSLTLLSDMGRAFRGSDVVLHAVDIRGVRVDNDLQKGAQLNSNEALFLIANPTGGGVFRNSNDLSVDLNRMMRQQEVVYILGFQPPVTMPGKFHELKVRVKDVSGARVVHRAGYYERGPENSLERALTTAEIILNDIPQPDIAVAALAAPFPTKRNAQVPVILEINGSDLLRNTKASALGVDIFVYAFDEEGIVRDRMFQRLNLDLAKLGEKIRQSGIKYYATLSLPQGRYALKSLVRVPETDRKGFARIEIVVPPTTDVAVLPPFFLEEPGKWLMVKGGSHDTTNAGYPFQINGEPFIPSASVRVRSGELRQFAVFVYNAAADEMAFETSVSDSNGSTHEANPKMLKELQGEDVTKLMFQYAPDDRDQAAARLDFTVRKKGSSEARRSSVALTVQR
jgi:VWFA-related protein